MTDTTVNMPEEERPGDEQQPTMEDLLGGDRDSTKWVNMIERAEEYFSKWQEYADKVDEFYGDLEALATGSVDPEMQIFWANLEVLKPVIFARIPKPIIRPRYRRRDPIARRAAEVLERAVETDNDRDDIKETLEYCRDDLLLPGRAAVWPRLHQDRGTLDLDWEHLDRRDFVHEPARKWKEVGWVAKGSWVDYETAKARFEDVYTEMHFEEDSEKPGEDAHDASYAGEKRARVWEIWHRRLNVVVWIDPHCEYVLDVSRPFLTLEGFFPCPKPAFNTLQRRTMLPIPDMMYYRDQLEEINKLTARISHLTDSLKLQGYYPGGEGELAKAIEFLINDSDDRATLVPVSSMGALSGQSLQNSIVWLPVREVAQTIAECIQVRRVQIEDVYQITGIADIMRGDTVASETLGAQKLKAQYGSARGRNRQGEIVRIATDMIRIKAEIFAEEFPIQQLLIMAQVHDLPTGQQIMHQSQQIQAQLGQMQAQAQQVMANPQAQQMAQQDPEQAQQVVGQFQQQMQGLQQQLQELSQQPTVEKVEQLLKSENIRPFVLEVESDSTIQPDEAEEQIRRTQFLTAFGSLVNSVGPMVEQYPQSAPLVAEALRFVAGGFRIGRTMDDAIDEFAEDIQKLAGQPRPDPAQQEAQLRAAAEKVRQRIEQAKLEMENQNRAKDRALENDKLALEREKFEFERNKADSESDHRNADRELQDEMNRRSSEQASEKEYLANGIPPKFDAVAIARTVEESAAATQAAIASLSKLISAPKQIVRDDRGKAAGVVTLVDDEEAA